MCVCMYVCVCVYMCVCVRARVCLCVGEECVYARWREREGSVNLRVSECAICLDNLFYVPLVLLF